MMHFITDLFGRFHPLLVHLPIGILFLAFLFECLSAWPQYRGLRKAVQPGLFCGTVFAIAAAISGYFLRQEGGYEEKIANLHQNFGIATVGLSMLAYVFRSRLKFWVNDPAKRKKIRILLLVPLILLLSITGHWGGSLTHGEDYLFAVVSMDGQEARDPAVKIRDIANIQEAILYDHVIQPILEARCYDCHSSRKQKGELRLDREEFIMRGGKEGEVISAGPADSSSLFKRLVLPIEDEDHMPPGEKPQLSSSEIALVKYWIEEKAHFDKSIAQFENEEKITAIIESLQEDPRQSWVPLEAVRASNENELRKLSALGITPMLLAADNNYLMVTFTNSPEITNKQLNALLEIRDQLIWLNLSQAKITDKQMEAIGKLSNLRVLYLNNTAITDTGLLHLSTLADLRWLSLVGTRITNQSISTFVSLKKLTNLFLYQTAITEADIVQLEQNIPEVKLDTGNYILKKLPTDTVVYKKIAKN